MLLCFEFRHILNTVNSRHIMTFFKEFFTLSNTRGIKKLYAFSVGIILFIPYNYININFALLNQVIDKSYIVQKSLDPIEILCGSNELQQLSVRNTISSAQRTQLVQSLSIFSPQPRRLISGNNLSIKSVNVRTR